MRISDWSSDVCSSDLGRDLLTIVESLRTGEGMRALAADGRLSTGMTAAESLRGGPTGEGLPVLFMGSSRGTMASGWAMAMNVDRACTCDEAELTCREDKGDPQTEERRVGQEGGNTCKHRGSPKHST